MAEIDVNAYLLTVWAEFALKRAPIYYRRIERVFPQDGNGMIEVLLIDRHGRDVAALFDRKGDLDEFRIGW